MYWAVEEGEDLDCLSPCEGYVRKRGRWGAARKWKGKTARIRFVRKDCMGEMERRAGKEGTRAARAALDIVEEWEASGMKPITDAERDREETRGKRLSGPKPILKGKLDDMKKNEWRKVRLCMDSGLPLTIPVLARPLWRTRFQMLIKDEELNNLIE